MKKRVITGVFLLAIMAPLIAIDHKIYPIVGTLFLIVGIILSMISSYEMMNMFYKKSPSLKKLRYVIPFFSGILVYTVYLSTTKGLDIADLSAANFIYHFLVVVVFLMFIIISMGLTIFISGSSALDMMSAVITLVYTGLIMGYVISIRYLETLYPATDGVLELHLRGGRSFGYLFAIVVATDTFAYLVGSKFGKNKLCPEISPKKTVEGALGGLIAGSIVGVVCTFLFNIVKTNDMSETIVAIIGSLILSMILSFTVQIGDLVASKLKRTYDIKDYGHIFPGHGGVLDRFDSLIFSGACFYIIVQIVQLFILGANR